MPHIAARVDFKTHKRIRDYCKDHHTNITEFLKSSIEEKLIGDTLSLDTDWKVNAVNLLGMTIGQFQYALMNGKSVSEIITRLNDKSDLIELLPIASGDKFAVQFDYKKQSDIVTIKIDGSKLDMVKKLLAGIENKIMEEVDAFDF